MKHEARITRSGLATMRRVTVCLSVVFLAGALILPVGAVAQVGSTATGFGFLKSWGATGNGPGEFDQPGGIADSPSGDIYVADEGNGRVKRLSSSGEFKSAWESPGWPQADVAVDSSGRVYVTDWLGHRVKRFSADGAFEKEWGSKGTDPGQFQYPTAIAVDGSDRVYVLAHRRVQRFDADGSFETEWSLGEPALAARDIAVDDSGRVYVADWGEIRVFDSDGALQDTWEIRTSERGPVADGIDVDGSGRVYVSDTSNDELLRYDADGTLIQVWGRGGERNGELGDARRIHVNRPGDLVVSRQRKRPNPDVRS